MNLLTDEHYMRRCVQLAAAGLPSVSPNPMVGCVIVHGGRIIGEGYHRRYGAPHAEVNAVAAVQDKRLLPESTLYVSLEPCAHHGKTPPCADLIRRMQIPEVVVGSIDPFERVAGKGLRLLREAGVHVRTGILKAECDNLNKRFRRYVLDKRPYIILKWAQTADGFIARSDYSSKWITGKAARMFVHKWRAEEAAVLVGTNTAVYDNPRLNVRDWAGPQPVRVVADRRLRLSPDLHLFDHSLPTVILNAHLTADQGGLRYRRINFRAAVPQQIAAVLYHEQLNSVLIEGGSALLNSFIAAGLWDEARIFTAESVRFGSGIYAPKLSAEPASVERIGNDRLELVYPA